MSADLQLNDYLRFFETVTPDSLDRLDLLTSSDVIFRDPFNEVRGQAAMRRVFVKMFAEVTEPRFRVLSVARQHEVAFIKWRFSGSVRDHALAFEGVSELHVDADGRVCKHLDYWDAAREVYERLPLLGWMLRRLRRRLATVNRRPELDPFRH